MYKWIVSLVIALSAFLGGWIIATEAVASVEGRVIRQAPLLISPADAANFGNIAEVKLAWQWSRPLNADERYDVRVWRAGEPAYGITWTTDSHLDLTHWLLRQPTGEYFWSIVVIQQDDNGQLVREVTDMAPPRRFTLVENCLCILEVPEGFAYEMYALLPNTQLTAMTFGDDGHLYVLNVNGIITRVADQDGDFHADEATILFDDPAGQLDWTVGMAFHQGQLYLSHSGSISTLTDSDGDERLDLLTPIVEGLPSGLHVFHSNNGIAFGPDNKLYVAVGATTDHGPLREPLEASILRMNPDGSDLEVFATGFRNPYDLAFDPVGNLFTADNSPDAMSASFPYLPPEELNWVRQGRDYGFPEVFGRAAGTVPSEPPYAELFTSSASAGLVYYAAVQFPPEFREGVFLAQFGSAADRPVRTGQQVVFIPFDPAAEATGMPFRPFVRFRTELGNFNPVDVTVGPDGALYIAEWNLGAIFRVSYTEPLVVADAMTFASQAALPAETLAQSGAADTMAFASQAVLGGEALFQEGALGVPGCATCHQSEPGGVGPSLQNLTQLDAARRNNLSLEAYIRQSILEPEAYVVPGYAAGVMYPRYGDALTTEQLDALVEYVLGLSS
jgi:glucose/arabinose dehydrogenase/cytochrome c551/c552